MLQPRIISHSLVALIFICSTFFSSHSHAQFGGEPLAFFGFSPSVISPGESTTLGWAANDPSVSSCRILGVPELANQILGTNGTITLTPTDNITATLFCGFNLSGIVEATVLIRRPGLSVSFSPSTVNVNQSSTFRWSSNGFSNCTDTAGPLSISGTSGSRALSSQTVGDISVTVRCTDANGSSLTRTATLSVVQPPPQMTISAPLFISEPRSVFIIWSSINTTSCFSSFLGSLEPTGSRFVFINQDTFISITCFGPGGNVTRTAFINLMEPTSAINSFECASEQLINADDLFGHIDPFVSRIGDQSQKVDINSDGLEDLIIVNSKTQIGYILLNEFGEFGTVSKVIEGISDIRQISNISINNTGNIQVDMTIRR